MSASNDVKREFDRQSSSEKRAIASSWQSFLGFAAKVVRITLDIIDILKNLYELLSTRY